MPGSKFFGSSRDKEGVHNANYILVQYKKLGSYKNVTLAIFHVQNFKVEKQPDGRIRIGTIGFADDTEPNSKVKYSNGGAIGRKGDKHGNGGHSHFEILKGRKWNLSNKQRLGFRGLCR